MFTPQSLSINWAHDYVEKELSFFSVSWFPCGESRKWNSVSWSPCGKNRIFFLFSQEGLQNGRNTSFLRFWGISWLKMKKRRPPLQKVSTRRTFFILFIFFLFSQEVLQNGRNVNKFPTFYKFFDILRHFLTENEKNREYIKKRYRQDEIFSFYSFFPFSVRKSSKMPEMCPKMVTFSLFLLLGAKIWNLGIKVKK